MLNITLGFLFLVETGSPRFEHCMKRKNNLNSPDEYEIKDSLADEIKKKDFWNGNLSLSIGPSGQTDNK